MKILLFLVLMISMTNNLFAIIKEEFSEKELLGSKSLDVLYFITDKHEIMIPEAVVEKWQNSKDGSCAMGIMIFKDGLPAEVLTVNLAKSTFSSIKYKLIIAFADGEKIYFSNSGKDEVLGVIPADKRDLYRIKSCNALRQNKHIAKKLYLTQDNSKYFLYDRN